MRMEHRQTLIEEGTKLYTPEGEIESYYCPFATFQDAKGEKNTLWGRIIKDAISSGGAQVGDVVNLDPWGLEDVTIQSKQQDGSVIPKVIKQIVWTVQPVKGPCVAAGIWAGKIVAIQDGAAIQKYGRAVDEVARHDLSKLSRGVKVGDIVDISYKGGLGIVGGRGMEKAGQER